MNYLEVPQASPDSYCSISNTRTICGYTRQLPLDQGSTQKKKTEPHSYVKSSKRKKNRGVVISVRNEEMTLFLQLFFFLGFSDPPCLAP